MEDDTSFDMEDLKNFSNIEMNDTLSFNSIENDTNDEISEIVSHNNVAKIHEYLDIDIYEQEKLLKKLSEFERNLDIYLHYHNS